MENLVLLAVDFAITSVLLVLAGKITGTPVGFIHALVSAVLASLFLLIPGIGWLLSIIALLILLKNFTGADIWPDVLLLVVVAKLFSNLIIFTLL